MKKIVFNCLFLTLLTIPLAQSQMGRFHKFSLNDNQVPVTVLESQNEHFPNGFVTNWFRYSNLPEGNRTGSYYISNFQFEGSNSFKAYYTDEGRLVSHVKFLPKFALPEELVENVGNTYLNTRIKSGDLIRLYDYDMEVYRLRINIEGLLQYVYFDKYARMLEGGNLPFEIMTLN